MENSKIYSKRVSRGTYNELMCRDDLSTDGNPFYHKQERKQVLMLMGSDGLRSVAMGLGMLSALLLVVDIGLAIHYSRVNENLLSLYQNFTQTSNELEHLRNAHSSLIKTKEKILTDLMTELQKVNQTNGQIHVAKQIGLQFEKVLGNLQDQKLNLQSRIAELGDSCGHCLPGWEHLNSTCYYFTMSEAIPLSSWKRSRENCIKQGADLAVIDSQEKQDFVTKAIQDLRYSPRSWHLTGFWIGLTDDHEEGNWKWLNRTKLIQGYWAPGEPNDSRNEDCAAIYSKNHPSDTWDPMANWNDAPCSFPLKWICEMKAVQ
ncbi:hypothetical protein UPYG_G00222770 [Umbra pygmaea]|uniref:C-type lectin domain-containing protein n=1 Tax=Umbra pygmaea TaxID=75934 RepID=A0ABD0WBV9_UMBPY